MAGRIEAWLYSTGSKTEYEATTTLTAGGTDAILSTSSVLADALTEWTADLGGGYTVTWATNSVTVANTGGNFTLSFTGNLHKALGFASASGYIGSDSYTGANQALARFDVLKMECSPIREGQQPNMRTYRHGRVESFAFAKMDYWQLLFWMTAAQADDFAVSYCVAGRIRAYQNTSDVTAYSATNTDGYLDGYVHSVDRLETFDASEDVVAYGMTLAVPR